MIRTRYMDVPAAKGGERRVKTTLFARLLPGTCGPLSSVLPFAAFAHPCASQDVRCASYFVRYMDVPAAKGGERRAKTTLFARLLPGTCDRSPMCQLGVT